MKKLHVMLLCVFLSAMFWSAFNNEDYFTWALEAAPALIGVAILIVTFKRFTFTSLAYVLITVHCIILLVGAKYTYAEVPLFNWLRDYFGMARNNYDKVGHFAQGFVPALIAREVIIRLHVLRQNLAGKQGWLGFFVVSICLAISAFYELIEWFVAELTGEGAEAFLGTQGYVWDTQSDMLCALLGALCMVIFLARAHDRAIARLVAEKAPLRP